MAAGLGDGARAELVRESGARSPLPLESLAEWLSVEGQASRPDLAADPVAYIDIRLPAPFLAGGVTVVDTPGVRQLALWDIRPEEVEGYFGEFRPFVPLCTFPDCTHTHETGCAVKDAVARRLVSDRRYHSYLGMFRGAAE